MLCSKCPLFVVIGQHSFINIVCSYSFLLCIIIQSTNSALQAHIYIDWGGYDESPIPPPPPHDRRECKVPFCNNNIHMYKYTHTSNRAIMQGWAYICAYMMVIIAGRLPLPIPHPSTGWSRPDFPPPSPPPPPSHRQFMWSPGYKFYLPRNEPLQHIDIYACLNCAKALKSDLITAMYRYMSIMIIIIMLIRLSKQQ